MIVLISIYICIVYNVMIEYDYLKQVFVYYYVNDIVKNVFIVINDFCELFIFILKLVILGFLFFLKLMENIICLEQ